MKTKKYCKNKQQIVKKGDKNNGGRKGEAANL